jgi:hypothetical protein
MYTGLLQKKSTVSTFYKTQTISDIDTHDARFCREPLEVCYSNLQMFDVCTLMHSAYINAIVEFLPNTRQHIFINSTSSCCDTLFQII